MSRHDHTPPMKRIIPPAHPAYLTYEQKIIDQAEKDLARRDRKNYKSTIGDLLALIGLMFIFSLVAAAAFALVMGVTQ